MRIVHVGPFKIGTIHGTYNALWALARAQAAGGHHVTVIRLGRSVAPEQVEIAERAGVDLVGWPHNKRLFWRDESERFAALMNDLNPDVVHLEYVREPKYFVASRVLRKRGIPFVISLHGGMNSTEMSRKRIRKLAYWYLIERGIHKKASGLHFVSAKEKEDYDRTWKMHKTVAAVVANPCELSDDRPTWAGIGDPGAPQIAYFGRYDPWHKGIDLAAELVRSLNRKGFAAQLHLYGSIDLFERDIRELLRDYRDVPITDHGFRSGPDLYRAMADHDLYIQYSRFEAFGMSLVEAMMLGVPAIVSENCDLAPDIAAARAAMVVPMDPARAAEMVEAALNDPEALRELAERGRRWAAKTCDLKAVTAGMQAFYVDAVNASGHRGVPQSRPPT